jgi:hypothetical protein
MCFFMSQFYSNSRSEKWFIGVVSFISVALTASGTGYLVLLVIGALCAMGERRIRIALPIVLIFSAIAFPSVMLLTGRGADYVGISLGTRVDIFVDALTNATMLPSYFGLGTNTGVLLGRSMDSSLKAQILDSTYASIVVNLGLVAFVLFLIALLAWCAIVLLIDKLELYVFTIVFLAFGAVVIVPECFPANLLFAALMSHYLGQYIRFGNVRSLPPMPQHGNALPDIDRQ